MGRTTHSEMCYQWHPECAVSEVERLRSIAARAGDVEGIRTVLKMTIEAWPDDAGKAAAAVSKWIRGE